MAKHFNIVTQDKPVTFCQDALPKSVRLIDVSSFYGVLVKQVGSSLFRHPVHVVSTGNTSIHHANNNTYL